MTGEMLSVLVQANPSSSSPTSGNEFLRISIDSYQPVANLITKFCEQKQIEDNSQHCLVDTQDHILDRKKPVSHYGIQSGDKLIFCSAAEKPKKLHSWSFIALAIVIISIISLIACLAIYLGLTTVPDSYAIVLDAGSTHTEIMLYKWSGNKINNTGLVIQDDACYIKGGVGELPGPAAVPPYLGPCLDKLRDQIPPESLDHGEIFFGATAGLRLLKELNDTAAEEVLTRIRQTLRETGLKFQESHARILSGSEEGAAGWLTVNYLNNQLLAQGDTWGALDLGGASTQISFELKENHALPENKSLIADFQVYGKGVKVFSKSFLCYGLVQATLRYRAYLILQRNSPRDRNVTSPCENIGYSNDVDAFQIFNSPCSPAPKDKEMALGNYTFLGTSNVAVCQATMRYILSEAFCQQYNLRECISLNDFPLGFQESLFMGFSAFGYINRTLGLSRNATRLEYENAIKSDCAKTLDQFYVRNDFTRNVTNSELQAACFKRFYMLTLLSDIYGFNTDSKWSNLQFGLQIQDKNLGWALGFMVNETQSITAAPFLYGMSTGLFTLLLALFSIFLLVSIGCLCHALKSRKPPNRPYRSLAVQA